MLLRAIVAALVIALAPSVASAYCLLKTTGVGAYVKWKTMPVTYRVSDTVTDPKVLAAIDKAFQTWQAVSCSTLTFKKGAPFTMCTTATCAPNTIKFLHGTNNIHVYWYPSSQGYPTGTNFIAYMYFWHDTVGGLVGGSIAVNAFNYAWSTTGSTSAIDVQNEMTAFIGSVIGLTDSNVNGATMFPGISYGDTSKRSLHLDDINGLVYLYKSSSCAAPPAPGATGCSAVLPADAGVPDSALPDAGPPDSAPAADTSAADAGVGDASADTTAVDAGAGEAPLSDAPLSDTPAVDAGSVDTSAVDSGGTGGDAITEGGGGADSAPGTDSGGAGGDSGGSKVDAATWDLSGGGDATGYVPPPSAEGCDCGVAAAPPAAALWLGLGMLWVLLRRRRR